MLTENLRITCSVNEMRFQTTLFEWLDRSLPETVPTNVKAFSFNLTNVYDQEYEIEIIGAEMFDEEDEDWAC